MYNLLELTTGGPPASSFAPAPTVLLCRAMTKSVKLSISDVYHFFDISDNRRALPGVAWQLEYASVVDVESILQMILFILSPLLPENVIPQKLHINEEQYKTAFATLLSRTKGIILSDPVITGPLRESEKFERAPPSSGGISGGVGDSPTDATSTNETQQSRLNVFMQNTGTMVDFISVNINYYIILVKRTLRIMALQWLDYQPSSTRKRYIKLCAKLEKLRQMSLEQDEGGDDTGVHTSRQLVLYRDLLQTLVSFVMAMRKPYIGFIAILLLFVYIPIIGGALRYNIKSPSGLDAKLTTMDIFANILFTNIRKSFNDPSRLSCSGGRSKAKASPAQSAPPAEVATKSPTSASDAAIEAMNNNCDAFLLNYMANVTSRFAAARRKHVKPPAGTMNSSSRVQGTAADVYIRFIKELSRIDAEQVMAILPLARFENLDATKIALKFCSPSRRDNIETLRNISHLNQSVAMAILSQKVDNMEIGNLPTLFPHAFLAPANIRDTQAVQCSGIYAFLCKRIKLRTLFDRVASTESVENFLIECFDVLATTRVFNAHIIIQILDLMRQHKIFLQDVSQFDGRVIQKILGGLGAFGVTPTTTAVPGSETTNDSFGISEDNV